MRRSSAECGFRGAEQELLIRRLKWWQQLAVWPDDAHQVLTAMLGQCGVELEPTVDEQGSVLEDANPFALRLTDDLTKLAEIEQRDEKRKKCLIPALSTELP